jgi:hypothetical protein
MLPPAMRGRTTQKEVSSTSHSPASGAICTLARIRWRSADTFSDSIRPTSTPLYLTVVFPASSPSADAKLISIVGPSDRNFCTAIQPPISAAMIGMIHTADSRVRRLGTEVASGRSGSS